MSNSTVSKPPPTAQAADVPPPTATPTATDPHTGLALLEQPITLMASSPTLADGTPLTQSDLSGTSVVDPGIASASFSYGALLYRLDKFGNVDIFNGTLFTAESSFDFSSPTLKYTELTFDAKRDQWTGICVLSTVGTTDPSFAATDVATLRPAYGFLTVLRIPRKPSATAPTPSASWSSLSSSFGVIATADTMAVKLGPLSGSVPVQDMSKADGFSIVAKDPLRPVASMILSANGSVPAGVTLSVCQSGSVRATVTVNATGDVTVMSTTQVVIDAPIVEINGELRARNIRYKPYAGGPDQYL